MPKVISVVSGKGGCGKSLLAAVLGRALARESERVLLVDMDIFVRGLTILLHEFRRAREPERLFTVSDMLGIFSSNSEEGRPLEIDKRRLNLARFYECDVLPSVDNIGAPLDYGDRDLTNVRFLSGQVYDLIKTIGDNYDYIILDCRAGMDSLMLSCCRVANFTISIAEDDPVGRQTNANLVNYLRYNSRIDKIYTIINKARNIKAYNDIKYRARSRSDFSELGYIPFDIEIIDNFGTDRFWSTVDQTLYFRALIDAWNLLSDYENTREIKESRYNFPLRIFMSKRQGRFTLMQRVLRLYSVLAIIGGFFMWIIQRYRYGKPLNPEIFSIILIGLGVIMLLFSTTIDLRSLIFGKDRHEYIDKDS